MGFFIRVGLANGARMLECGCFETETVLLQFDKRIISALFTHAQIARQSSSSPHFSPGKEPAGLLFRNDDEPVKIQ
jgi:hypothetical protein